MAYLRRWIRSVPTIYAVGVFGIVVTGVWATQNYRDPLRISAVLLLAVILLGLVTTIWTLYETISELEAQRSRRPGDTILARIAWANVRREIVRVAELLAFLIISLNVLLNVGVGNSVMNRSLLILIVLLLVANGVLDRIERDQTSADLADALSQPKTG